MTLTTWIALLAPNAAAQVFTPPPDAQWAVGAGGWGMHTVGDFDGDGVGDVAWVLPQQSLSIAFGQAGAAPLAPIAVPLGGETPSGPPVVADLDADGFDDLFAQVLSGAVIRGWPGAPGGPSGPVWTLTDGRYARGVGDVNGDGARDLALGTTVWLSSPAGPTLGPALPNAEGNSHLFDVGDVNGDGYDDVAGPDPRRDPSGGYYDTERGPLRLYLGGPAGPSTTPLWSHDVSGTTGWTLTMADVDGDGVRELVAAALTLWGELAEGSVVVLDDLANPAGPLELTITPGEFDIGQGFELGTLGDRDGDGAEEVVVGLLGRVQEVPWTAGGGLDFTAPGVDAWVSPSGETITSLVTADVDGDGFADLSVHWRDETTNAQEVTVWLMEPPPPGTPTDTGTTSPPETGDTGAPDPGTTDTGLDTGVPDPEPEDPAPAPSCGCALGVSGTSAPLGLVFLAILRRRRG